MKTYWIGQRYDNSYDLIVTDGVRPKRRKMSGYYSAYGWSPFAKCEILIDFCAERFAEQTGITLKMGEVRRISWRIWKEKP